MVKTNFSGLKLKVKVKVIGAISTIDFLKSFMAIPKEMSDGDADRLMWKVIIHRTFVLSGLVYLVFALMGKSVGDTKKH